MELLRRCKQSFIQDWPSYLVIALAFSIQIFLIRHSFVFLLTNVLPDDAFYYFEIARNISRGLGSTFDGVEMTNGYHPLWMVVLVPLFSMLSVGGVEDFAPIYAALTVAAFCGLAVNVAVFCLVSRVTEDRWIRAVALFLWAVNPFLLFEIINGLETALTLVFVSLFFLAVVSWTSRLTRLREVLLGGVAGLMILARLDMAVYLAVYLLWLSFSQGTIRSGLLPALRIGLVATAFVLPWFIWNYLSFGMFLTSAAGANTEIVRQLIVQDNGESLFMWVKAVVYMLDHQVRLLLLHTGAPAALIALLGAVAVLLAQGMVSLPRHLARYSPTLVMFVGFLLLFFINVVLRFMGRSWYFVTVGIFIALLAAFVLPRILASVRYRGLVLLILFSFVSYSFAVSWSKALRNQYALQEEMYAAALWANDALPDKSIIGSFNSGVQGYFSNHRVVNLDGLVNNAAYAALVERRLWAYMTETGITHLIDFEIYRTYRFKSFYGIPAESMPLQLVTTIQQSEHSRSAEGIRVYALP